jgi:hypothetical protein
MIDKLIHSVNQAARGLDNYETGAIGFRGYGFVFRDSKVAQDPYVFTTRSSKLTAFDIRGEFSLPSRILASETLEEMLSDEDLRAPIYGARVKTLLPTLKFGGYEMLFYSWLFVKTPRGQTFPATFYYGPSGLAIGAWKPRDYDEIDQFYPDFMEIINSSPFSMDYNELEAFCDALKNALDKVPATDYYAQYGHDMGTALMGVKRGKPFIYEIGKRRTKAFLQKFYNNIYYDSTLL